MLRTHNSYSKNYPISKHEIAFECNQFYRQYGVIPDTIKLSYEDMNTVCMIGTQTLQPLEAGKTYAMYLPIVGGLAELVLLSEEEETNLPNYDYNNRYIVLESSTIDRAFEKHILNSESKDE